MAPRNVNSLKELEDALKSSQNVALHFWASWCEPSVHMDIVFEQLSVENPEDTFIRVEAEEQAEISEKYEVPAVPYFLFFKNGEVIDRLEGASPPELAHKVGRHFSAPSSATTAIRSGPVSSGLSAGPAVLQQVVQMAQAASKPPEKHSLSDALKSRLQTLINSNSVMLFMKGNPSAPRCGFSSKTVAALQDVGVEFGSFDILSDEEVRQGLKELSDWPTYPQLYCKGELIGGSDIILEMHKSGELKELFEEKGVIGKQSLEGRLRALVNSHKVMLFMKGTPEEPRCGFSRKVVEALKSENVEFGSFDIFSDEDVRQGLKKLYDWPTYPQLYSKGELVGGCDIVLELHENGELISALED